MASLYEIDSNILAVLNGGFVVDEETGEILFDAGDLEALEAERGAKLESIACFIKNLDADAAALKAEEKALAERRQAKERKAQRLREYLAASMQQAEQTRFETARCALSFRKSESVEILDAEALPADLVNIKQTIAPDKAAIKKLLKAGGVVEGAQLVERQNLQVK